MPEPRQPEDHKPKKDKRPPVEEPKRVVLDGHDYLIDPARMDDLRFLEAYEDEKWVTVLRMMLGPEQWAQFYANHSDENGRVTGAKFSEIINELAESDLELGN